jgi:hypothetical protein
VETVLGLSMTSNSIAWVLLDGPGADATTLYHDHFDIVPDAAIDGDITKHRSTLRGAQTIAEADGHRITSIAVTWTEDVEAKAALVLKRRRFSTTPHEPHAPRCARVWTASAGG